MSESKKSHTDEAIAASMFAEICLRNDLNNARVQSLGRVGRVSQNCKGSVIIPSIEMFDACDYESIRSIFDKAVQQTLTEIKR